jgi:hypothetical protein
MRAEAAIHTVKVPRTKGMGDVIVDRRADQHVVDVDDHQEQPTTEAGRDMLGIPEPAPVPGA